MRLRVVEVVLGALICSILSAACGDSGVGSENVAVSSSAPATSVNSTVPSTSTSSSTASLATATTSTPAAVDGCAVFTVDALEKATRLTGFTQGTKQNNGCNWRSGVARPDGSFYITAYGVDPASRVKPEIDAGTYTSSARVDKITVDNTTVLYSAVQNAGWKFITFKFLATDDKAVVGNISLPDSADPPAVIASLAQLYLASRARLA
jgi:hypothetical protein